MDRIGDKDNNGDKKLTESVPEGISNRVWEHALHEETVFNATGNFFLIAEAMLLVFYATLIDNLRPWALLASTALGLLLTLMWLIINIRQEKDLKTAKQRLEKYCPEYTEYLKDRDRKSFRSARPVLSVGVPIVIILTWLTLVIEILYSSY